jgi:hypothetical protein
MMLYRIITIFLLLITPALASAHQQKEAYITLLFNESSGNLEVSHRFLVHDAEHIFAELFDVKELNLSGDILNDERTQAAFAAYVNAHFSLADANKVELKLNSLGYEVEGKHFWMYQETTIPQTAELHVKHTALHDIWHKQVNHINVEINGQVTSVRLQKQDGSSWRSIKLPVQRVE